MFSYYAFKKLEKMEHYHGFENKLTLIAVVAWRNPIQSMCGLLLLFAWSLHHGYLKAIFCLKLHRSMHRKFFKEESSIIRQDRKGLIKIEKSKERFRPSGGKRVIKPILINAAERTLRKPHQGITCSSFVCPVGTLEMQFWSCVGCYAAFCSPPTFADCPYDAYRPPP